MYLPAMLANGAVLWRSISTASNLPYIEFQECWLRHQKNQDRKMLETELSPRW